ncbi:MAG: hypothetical protein K0S56_2230 [Microvirga sp.]|nr:hypothetical protein [Microvirga sp.]
MPTEEPAPRLGGEKRRSTMPDWPLVTEWSRLVGSADRDFFHVLGQRRSRVGGDLPEPTLAAVLRHATQLREARGDGRFGTWESRTAPSAGGLHALRLLVLGVGSDIAGLYDCDAHALRAPTDLSAARELNSRSVRELAGAEDGVTLQLVADARVYSDCYDAWETLMWRDAGAMAMVLSLVATALSAKAVILGRRGDDILFAAGVPGHWMGAGAIHVSGQC